MKNLLACLFLLVLCYSCKKEENDPIVPDPKPTYHTFNGQIGSNDNSTLISADQNLLICGNTPSGICVIKISKSGSLIWRKDFNAGNYNQALAMAQSNDQSIFVCGYTDRNEITTLIDILLIKLNPDGDTLWTKTYGSSCDVYGYYMINTQDGNLLICGVSTHLSSGDNKDIYLVKVNTDGDTLWTKTYLQDGDENPNHVLQTQNGEFLITGSTRDSNSENRQLYLFKVSADGVPLWNKKIGSPGITYGKSTIELFNGDLMTCGGDTNQVFVVKTDAQGNVYWEKQYGETYLSEYGSSMKQNADGTFIITGGSYEDHSGQHGILLLKIAQDGNQLLLKDFGHNFVDYGQNVLKNDNDDNIITGQYGGGIFMTRTDGNGEFN